MTSCSLNRVFHKHHSLLSYTRVPVLVPVLGSTLSYRTNAHDGMSQLHGSAQPIDKPSTYSLSNGSHSYGMPHTDGFTNIHSASNHIASISSGTSNHIRWIDLLVLQYYYCIAAVAVQVGSRSITMGRLSRHPCQVRYTDSPQLVPPSITGRVHGHTEPPPASTRSRCQL